MSEPKWTPAQRAAIEDRGGALLVSAAAGSGKTAVLTERAVRLITDPDTRWMRQTAHRHLYQCGGGRAAGTHRAGTAAAQPAAAPQHEPAPPADAFAARTHLHH